MSSRVIELVRPVMDEYMALAKANTEYSFVVPSQDEILSVLHADVLCALNRAGTSNITEHWLHAWKDVV